MENVITQSPNDKKQYRSIKLDNQVEVFLISDQETQRSAAAMVVNVGSFEDPPERQGLAHFLEHMLFLGSEKYPDEGAYRDYIQSNSGSCNAYTAVDHTNYQFQIANKAFQGALDRFAQFFIKPTFTESGTQREMKAVDSEFNMNWKEDFWRRHLVMKQLSKPGHKYSAFQIGNLKSLQFDDTRDHLLKFYQRWYSSNIMKLVVLGAESLDTLEQWVREIFTAIPNNNVQPAVYNDLPYEKYRKVVRYVPINDEDLVEVRWIVDYLKPHYKENPGSYITNLLGHEGENSLLSLLIAEGLGLELSAYHRDEMQLFSYITCRVKLTKKGLRQVDRVVAFIFQYVDVLRAKGAQEWFYKELQFVNELQFQHLEGQTPFSYTSSIAAKLIHYPARDVLKTSYMTERFDADLINKFINQMRRDNVFVIITSQEFKGQLESREQYFDSEYAIQEFPSEFQIIDQPLDLPREKYQKPLDLPPPNLFIPKDTSILSVQDESQTVAPTVIYESPQSQLWYKRDNVFNVPLAFVWVRILTSEQGYGANTRTQVLASLWTKILNFHTKEIAYQAELAGLKSELQKSPNGLTLSFSGFNDSVPLYVKANFEKWQQFNIQDYRDFFDDVYQNLKKSYRNQLKEKPYYQVQHMKGCLLKQGNDFTYDQLLEEINTVTFEELVDFSKNWLKTVRFNTLIEGNILSETAIQIQKDIETIFNSAVLSRDDVQQFRPVKLPTDTIINYSYKLLQPDETNSSILVHYQMGPLDLREQVKLDVMHNLIKTDFFEQLRTQEQLGYAVFAMTGEQRGVYSYEFLIQSNQKPCHYVQERIRFFVNGKMQESINNLTEQKFNDAIKSVSVALLQKDFKLYLDVQRNWNQIMQNTLVFDIRQKKLAFLESIKLEEIQDLYRRTFLSQPRQFELHANCGVHVDEDAKLREGRTGVRFESSVRQTKRKLELYPDFYAY